MYKNIVFDLYGTLVDIRTNEDKPGFWQTIAMFMGFQGAVYMPDELRSAYHGVINSMLDKLSEENTIHYSHESFPEIKIEEAFRTLYTCKGVTPSDELLVHTCQLFRATSMERLKLYPGVRKLLATLKKSEAKVYLLSNAQKEFTKYELKYLGIENFFDGILISSDEGVRKPDVEFFKLLNTRFGVDFKESIMIGNDSISDILPAKELGMATYYVRSQISPKDDPIPKADFVDMVFDGDKMLKKLI